MIDLHCHVLPGIDDGALDLEEAAEMCRAALADGCDTLVATPHQRHEQWDNDDSAALEALRRELQDEVGEAPRVLLGAEIRIDSELLDDLDRSPPRAATPLAGSRYLLLELGRARNLVPPEPLVHELVVAGRVPVFAHPEFIRELAADLDRMAALKERGALFQVTAMSLTGEFGEGPRRTVEKMLDLGLADFVASDSHHLDWRPPGLSAARAILAARWGEAAAERLTLENPRAVVENRPLGSPFEGNRR